MPGHLVNAPQLLARLDQMLTDLRQVAYQDVACLVVNVDTIPALFGTRYEADTWCAVRETVVMLSALVPEGAVYWGTRRTLDGGDDAIREMEKEQELHDHRAKADADRRRVIRTRLLS